MKWILIGFLVWFVLILLLVAFMMGAGGKVLYDRKTKTWFPEEEYENN